MHEIVIGTREELQAHAELMKKHPNMEHDEPYMAHVNRASAATSSGPSTARAISSSPA
jgi:hypothetical protein